MPVLLQHRGSLRAHCKPIRDRPGLFGWRRPVFSKQLCDPGDLGGVELGGLRSFTCLCKNTPIECVVEPQRGFRFVIRDSPGPSSLLTPSTCQVTRSEFQGVSLWKRLSSLPRVVSFCFVFISVFSFSFRFISVSLQCTELRKLVIKLEIMNK